MSILDKVKIINYQQLIIILNIYFLTFICLILNLQGCKILLF